jgi:RecA-family ATPase
MINMELSPSERDIVFRRVWAIDLVGEPFKLAEFSRHVLRPHFENLDKLIIRCNELKPDRIIFDPLMSFSIGESHVNDAEQAIVEASRYIMRKIPNCAVDVVHHTGKGNARAGTTDQYSGRNGSALPDGARMVAVLNKMSTDSFYEATGIKLNFSKRESGLLLSLPKLSYCAPQSDIYIHRRDFLFEAVKPLDIEMREAIANENKAANKNATLETTRQSLLRALTELSSSDDPRDRYPSSSRLLDANGVTGKTSNRKQVLEDLLTLGAIVELNFSEAQLSEFPSKSVLGGRKTYLAIPDNEL